MKVRKTSGGGMVGKIGYSRASKSTENAREAEPVDVADTVSLSAEALSASGVEATNDVAPAGTSTDSSLPDPYETSRAMLEKELARVFREVYL